MKRFNRWMMLLAAIALALAPAMARAAGRVEMQEFMVPAADPGIQLYVRNKHPAGARAFSADRVLVYVHGATYPAETAFDLAVDGASMMDMLAARGWDVWMLDVRGYSRSTRPPEMDRPAADNKPIVDTATAARDVGSVVDFVMKRRHVAKVNLMGWSWGTSIMGLYTTTHNANVSRLVLYAPQWLSETKVPTDAPPLGAYRSVTRDAARDRWLMGVADDKKAALIPPGWYEAWANATFATDPVGAKPDPARPARPERRRARQPRLLDGWQAALPALRYHCADLADPRGVGCRPADLSDGGLLRGVEEHALQAVGAARRGNPHGHPQKNRMQFIHAVEQFLEEQRPQELN